MSRTRRKLPYRWFRNPKGHKQAAIEGARSVPPTSWDDLMPRNEICGLYNIATKLYNSGMSAPKISKLIQAKCGCSYARAMEITQHGIDMAGIRMPTKRARRERWDRKLAAVMPGLIEELVKGTNRGRSGSRQPLSMSSRIVLETYAREQGWKPRGPEEMSDCEFRKLLSADRQQRKRS